MLSKYVESLPVLAARNTALRIGDSCLTFEGARSAGMARAKQLEHLRSRRVGLCWESPLDWLISVLALDALNCHVALAGPITPQAAATLAESLGWEGVVDGRGNVHQFKPLEPAPEGPGTVTILTSGTTGAPKPAVHTWESLGRPVRQDARFASTRWLVAYPLHRYAGLQVFLQAFLNAAETIVPESMDPRAIADTLAVRRVQFASGTPTFWRQLLLFAPTPLLAKCALQQITLGGETVTEDILHRLRAVFPGARIVHIYASTELGRLFSVTDGREGFPIKLLDSANDGVELRIVAGELHARSPNAMLRFANMERAADGGWRATGDMVEVRGDRVLFRGRRQELINVGGFKVSPLEVEDVLRGVPQVADVRVFGKKSSMVGQIVAADVVVLNGASTAEVQRAIDSAAMSLQPHQRPRLINFVPRLEVGDAMKVVRSVS